MDDQGQTYFGDDEKIPVEDKRRLLETEDRLKNVTKFEETIERQAAEEDELRALMEEH